MGKIGLQIKATLEGLEKIATSQPDFEWVLKLKCTTCGEVSDKWHDVTLTEKTMDKTGHLDLHFWAKCKLCGKENSLTILENTIKDYTKDDNEKLKTVVVFECRGLEPVDFDFRGGWTAVAEESRQVYTDIDLSEHEWVDYDEKMQRPVGIYGVEHAFVRIK